VLIVDELIKGVYQATALGFAYDNEEAEIGVGCIGVLIHDNSGKSCCRSFDISTY